jgi:hypothetical protein
LKCKVWKPSLAAQQVVGEIANSFVHAQGIQMLDALDHLLDLARTVG